MGSKLGGETRRTFRSRIYMLPMLVTATNGRGCAGAKRKVGIGWGGVGGEEREARRWVRWTRREWRKSGRKERWKQGRAWLRGKVEGQKKRAGRDGRREDMEQ